MKKAAKVLVIIGLVIGLIWAVIGFFGSWFGGAVKAAVIDSSKDVPKTIENTETTMLKMIGGFVVVIAAGVLGIVGSDKDKKRIGTILLGTLTLVGGVVLMIWSNWIAAALYIVAGFLLVLAGATLKNT